MRRLPLALALIPAVALAVAAGCATGRGGAPVDLRPWTSRSSWDSCGRCHVAVFDEWRKTLHAQAWTDGVFRMSAGTPPKTECRSCHSMEPVLAGEISTDYSWRPVYRDYNQDDGVGCVSCHLRADGTVAARADHPTAPCRPRRDDRIGTPEYCGACHNPSHDAYNEWKGSHYARDGVSCSSCHSWAVTRAVEGGPPKTGYSHAFPGGNTKEFVLRAIHATTRLEGRTVVMRVTNQAGHKFPGEVPTRIFFVQVEPYDAEGNALEDAVFTFKRPFKTQTGVPDNRLKPDETRELRQELPAAAKFVRVSYVWKPSPLVPPAGWTVLERWESEIR